MTILCADFPDDLLPDAAHYEYSVGGHVIDDPLIVQRLSTLFSELGERSLGAHESRTLIAQLAELTLWVPNRSSMSGNLGILVDQSSEPVAPLETKVGC